MQCVQCDEAATHHTTYDGERALFFCGDACQRAHWLALSDEERRLVAVERVNLTYASFTKEDMGRAGWAFLHAVAASLEDGEITERYWLTAFVESLRRMYPCEMCRAHFDEMLNAHPPAYESGVAFRRWLCERHNDVNRRLDKQCWPCERVSSEHGTCDESTMH